VTAADAGSLPGRLFSRGIFGGSPDTGVLFFGNESVALWCKKRSFGMLQIVLDLGYKMKYQHSGFLA
jgi:hypothetical protein